MGHTRNRPLSSGVSTYRDRRRCAGKMPPDKAEAEDGGGPSFEAGNEGWQHFSRNPKGRGHFSPVLRRSSLRYTRYLSLLAPRPEQKWLPSPAFPICRYTLEDVPGEVLVFDDGGDHLADVFGGDDHHLLDAIGRFALE